MKISSEQKNDFILKKINNKVVLEKYVGKQAIINLPSFIQALEEKCFSECLYVQQVFLNENIKKIPKAAFQGCENLQFISLNNVIEIEEEAFSNCQKLKDFYGDNLCYIGDRAFNDCGFEELVFSDNIKNIGSGAFKNCTELRLVKINDNLQSLNPEIFAGCIKLKEVKLSKNLKCIEREAFLSCENLIELEFFEKLELIGDGAFINCGLKHITLPNSLKEIQDSAFEGCFNLQEICFPQNEISLGREAFKDCKNLKNIDFNCGIFRLNDYVFANCKSLVSVNLTKGIKEIGCKAFLNCKSLQNVELGKDLDRICESAFSGCSELKNIELPQNLKFIERKAFNGCTSLTKLSFPKLMNSLGAFAFKGCKQLKEVVLPNGIVEIKAGLFSECSSLKNVVISKSIQTICAEAFSHCENLKEVIFLGECEIFEENAFFNCGLEKIELPNGLKKIGISCFENSKNLKQISFGNGLLQIEAKAFKNCKALINVFFPDSLTNLDTYCFAGCSSLEEIKFGKGVKFVGNNAFFECSSLRKIFSENIEVLGNSAFENCERLENLNFNQKKLKRIGNCCFKNTSIKELLVPSCWIGDFAFSSCNDLKSVKIYPSTNFSKATFANCVNLENVKIEQGCGRLGESVFENCTSLKTINIPKSVGIIMSNSFLECHSLKDVTLENGISEIGPRCFENCRDLSQIVLPQSIMQIGENAFAKCSLSRIEFPQDVIMQNQVFSVDFENCLLDESFMVVLGNNLKNDGMTNVDFKKFGRVIENFKFEYLFKGINFSSLEELAKKMKRVDFAFPLDFLLKLNKNKEVFNKLIKNGEFTIFNNEFKGLTQSFSNLDNKNKVAFFKLALIFGCFSRDIIINFKKSTTMMKCQLASMTLAQIYKKKVFGENYDLLLENFPIQTETSPDFIKFVGETKNGNFENLEMLLNLEFKYKGIFLETLTKFDKVKSMRIVTGAKGNPKKISWEKAIIRNFLGQNYTNIDEENKELANVFYQKGVSQNYFDEACRIIKFSKKRNIPSHILKKALSEKNYSETSSINDGSIKEFSKDKRELAKLFKDNFSYEWLDKYSPKNFILGHYTSCCGSITSEHYGRNITLASVESECVQSLVIKDCFADIVAKGTMYLNRDLGYAVFNDFEVNQLYLNKKESENKIFDAFIRGINAFVAEYNKQNKSNLLKQVNVGGGNNKLIDLCEERCEKSNLIFFVPSNFDFQDAQIDQFVIYQQKNLKKEKEFDLD